MFQNFPNFQIFNFFNFKISKRILKSAVLPASLMPFIFHLISNRVPQLIMSYVLAAFTLQYEHKVTSSYGMGSINT